MGWDSQHRPGLGSPRVQGSCGPNRKAACVGARTQLGRQPGPLPPPQAKPRASLCPAVLSL